MTFGTKRIQVRSERARVCAKKIAGLWEGGICAWEDRQRAGHGGTKVRPQGRTRSRRQGKYVKCPLIREDLKVIQYQSQEVDNTFFYIRWYITVQLYVEVGSEAPLSRG